MFLSHPIYNVKHSLLEHSLAVAKKTREILDETNLNISNVGFYAGLFHDIGKLNPLYQIAFLETDEIAVKQKISELEHTYIRAHSPFSEFISRFILEDKQLDMYELDKISSVIYYHHSSLKHSFPDRKNDRRIQVTKQKIAENLKEFEQEASCIKEFSNMNWKNCHEKIMGRPLSHSFDLSDVNENEEYFDEYIKNSCLFSALLQADKGYFTAWNLRPFNIEINTSQLVSSPSDINDLRTSFQRQVLENIDLSNDINVLEAPTGIGKTKAFLDLILKYKDFMCLDRVYYFSPLLALTDDFEKKILEKEIISKSQMDRVLEYNHLYSGSLEEKFNQEKDRNNDDIYEQYRWKFEDESFNQNFIITTTARLLMTLYSNRNNDRMKLISFRKSLLIIDEVQTLPKFLLTNLVEYLKRLASALYCKIILVSATIPYPLENLPKIRIDKNILNTYCASTKKNIVFSERQITDVKGNEILVMSNTRKNAYVFQIPQKQNKKILVMSNTRKKASRIYIEYKEKFSKHENLSIFYLSSGICKIDRLKVFSKLRAKQDLLCISTQVIEAGIDISFSDIYREAAPIDSIIQVMGRLNREMEYNNSLLTIFQEDKTFLPYSDVEYNESLPILKQIQNSEDLYEKLKVYYKKIYENNQRDKNRNHFLDEALGRMDFQDVWDKIREYTDEQGEKDPVIIPPSQIEFDKIKKSIIGQKKVSKEIWKNCAKYIANLPISPYHPKIIHMFDEELLELNFLMPKPEFMYDTNKKETEFLYDPNIGLDKWLNM